MFCSGWFYKYSYVVNTHTTLSATSALGFFAVGLKKCIGLGTLRTLPEVGWAHGASAEY